MVFPPGGFDPAVSGVWAQHFDRQPLFAALKLFTALVFQKKPEIARLNSTEVTFSGKNVSSWCSKFGFFLVSVFWIVTFAKYMSH